MINTNKYHTFGTITKSNIKIMERGKIVIRRFVSSAIKDIKKKSRHLNVVDLWFILKVSEFKYIFDTSYFLEGPATNISKNDQWNRPNTYLFHSRHISYLNIPTRRIWTPLSHIIKLLFFNWPRSSYASIITLTVRIYFGLYSGKWNVFVCL